MMQRARKQQENIYISHKANGNVADHLFAK